MPLGCSARCAKPQRNAENPKNLSHKSQTDRASDSFKSCLYMGAKNKYKTPRPTAGCRQNAG